MLNIFLSTKTISLLFSLRPSGFSFTFFRLFLYPALLLSNIQSLLPSYSFNSTVWPSMSFFTLQEFVILINICTLFHLPSNRYEDSISRYSFYANKTIWKATQLKKNRALKFHWILNIFPNEIITDCSMKHLTLFHGSWKKIIDQTINGCCGWNFNSRQKLVLLTKQSILQGLNYYWITEMYWKLVSEHFERGIKCAREWEMNIITRALSDICSDILTEFSFFKSML